MQPARASVFSFLPEGKHLWKNTEVKKSHPPLFLVPSTIFIHTPENFYYATLLFYLHIKFQQYVTKLNIQSLLHRFLQIVGFLLTVLKRR